MAQELERRTSAPATLPQLSGKQIEYIAGTDFIPKAIRGNVPAIIACVRAGRELGLADMESLRSLYIVDGRVTMSAELMVKLIRRAGHSITGAYGDGTVTATGKRGDNGDEMSVTWTRDMALRADLMKKDNWKKYPEAMLWARAVSQLARMLFPDCLGAVSHTEDEVELSPQERVSEAIGEARPVLGDGPDDGPRAAVEVIEDAVDAEFADVDEQETLASFAPPAGVEDDENVRAALAAAEFVLPEGQFAGERVGDLAEKGERGGDWLLVALKRDLPYRETLLAYARVFFPDVYTAAGDGN